MGRCRSFTSRLRGGRRSTGDSPADTRRRRASILSMVLGGALGAVLAIGPVADGAGPDTLTHPKTETKGKKRKDPPLWTTTPTGTTDSSTTTTPPETTTTRRRTTTTQPKPRPPSRTPAAALQAPGSGAPPLGPAPQPAVAGPDFNTVGQGSPARAAGLMRPFPIVTIAGRLTAGGARVELLDVRAPRIARVSVLCRGRGCPRREAPARRRRARGAVKRVRLRHMERTYAAGTMLQVFVTAPGLIGKYTRFTIREAKVPARKDLCLMPATPRKPAACPPGTSPIRAGRRSR